MPPILHIAQRADWENAQATGVYETSTRGRTLAEEGFIHCSHDDHQVQRVLAAFYADATDLVLLTIDPTGLDVRPEPVGDETFPHLYEPLPTTAVTQVRPLPDNR